MKAQQVVLVAGMALLSACCFPPKQGGAVATLTKEQQAVELCGEIAKLQLNNVRVLQSAGAIVVRNKTETISTYADLTPQFRASAMRSNSHCIGLHTGRLTGAEYDKLMTAEAVGPALAERSLSPEQLQDAIDKGYKMIASILKDGKVSTAGVNALKAEVANGTAKLPKYGDTASNGGDGLWGESDVTLASLDKKVNELPVRIAEQLRVAQTKPELLVTLFFPNGRANLTPTGIADLERLVRPRLSPSSRFTVLGSADTSGNPESNSVLSYQRAQVVAAWIITKLSVEPNMVNVMALGPSTLEKQEGLNRSVKVLVH